MRFREGKWLAQGHTDGAWLSQDLNTGKLAPESMLLTL